MAATSMISTAGGIMNPQRTRILVFGIFLVALIVFAILYQPTKALSDPANQTNAVTSSGVTK